MRRTICLSGVGFLLIASAFLLTDGILSAPPGVTPANVKRVRQGMTMAEVAALLGGPGSFSGKDGGSLNQCDVFEWKAGTARAWVWFGGEGLACKASYHRVRQPNTSLHDPLITWLGW